MHKVEIDEILATKVIAALSLASEPVQHREAATKLLEQLAAQVGQARSDAHKAEADRLAEREMSLQMARRLAKAAVTAFDQTGDIMIKALTQGTGLSEYQIANLLRAQAQFKLYTLISTAVEDESVLERVRYTLQEAKQTLAGGRKCTDSVDRAVMEYDRDAAARFVQDWESLV